jgi:hypothetical protein
MYCHLQGKEGSQGSYQQKEPSKQLPVYTVISLNRVPFRLVAVRTLDPTVLTWFYQTEFLLPVVE